jgi:hypothetical protein
VKRKKTRQHNRGRCDSSKDYGHKLSPADRAWLERFEDEYYRLQFDRDESKQLHNLEQRRQIYRADHAARRDVLGHEPDRSNKPPHCNTSRYTADDYNQTHTEHPEDALVELLDRQTKE